MTLFDDELEKWFPKSSGFGSSASETRIAEAADKIRKRYEGEGYTLEINRHLPTIAIDRGKKSVYFSQGDEASQMLDEVPEWMNEESYIFFILDSAGVFEEG